MGEPPYVTTSQSVLSAAAFHRAPSKPATLSYPM
jgi:hypothetical protein